MSSEQQGQWMAAFIIWTLFVMTIVTVLCAWVVAIWVIGDLVL